MRILLVDDDPLVLRTMRMTLTLEGHSVVDAENGVKALALFSDRAFELVITDFDMPEMDGKRLAEAIRKIAPAQPIILITAHSKEIGETDKYIDLVLEKPFDSQILRKGIDRVLSRTNPV